MEEEVVILQAGHNEADRESRGAGHRAPLVRRCTPWGAGPPPAAPPPRPRPAAPRGSAPRRRLGAPLRVATRFEAAEVADNFVTRLAQFRLNTNQHDRNNPTLRAYAVPPPVEAITPAEAAALHAAPRAYEPID